MGLVATLVNWLIPQNRLSIPSSTPGLYGNYGGSSRSNYLQHAYAYQNNEIVYTAVHLLSTSAAEPEIIGRRWRRDKPRMARVSGQAFKAQNLNLITNGFIVEVGDEHPLIHILNHPNPFLKTRAEMMRLLVMDRYLDGNAYVAKLRTDLGNVSELWRLRPDKVTIIPDKNSGVAGYEYVSGDVRLIFPEEDVIHWREPNPLDHYYGQSPMCAIMPRVYSDGAMREATRTFYETGGTGPGAILTLSGKLDENFKTEVRDRLRRMLGQPGAFRETLILEQGTSSYQRLGLERGMTDFVPLDVNKIMESRIAMVFGIPASILNLLVGMESSSYANKDADWRVFWDITMTPLLSDFDDGFTAGLCHEFGGVDEVLFDRGDITALQEDMDALQERARKNYAAGLAGRKESRAAIGLDPEYIDDEFLVPTTGTLTRGEDLAVMPDAGASQVFDPNAIANEMQQVFRAGRPALLADPGARATYDRAMNLRDKNPTWSWLMVADKLGISERQLRRYRQEFE